MLIRNIFYVCLLGSAGVCSAGSDMCVQESCACSVADSGTIVCSGGQSLLDISDECSLLDEDVAIVNGVRLFKSHLDAPRVDRDWSKISYDEMIDEELVLQKARELGVSVSALEVDNQMMVVREICGKSLVSDSEWKEWLLSEHGLSGDAVRRQIWRGMMVCRFKAMMFPVLESVAIDKIEAYCEDNPEYESESYRMESAFLDDSEVSRESMDWIDLGFWSENELDDSLKGLSIGDVSEPIETDDGRSQVVRVVEKTEPRLKTVDDRKSDVSRLLIVRDQEERIKSYMDRLRDESSVIRLKSRLG